jgi:antitoxin ParD1/3/4
MNVSLTDKLEKFVNQLVEQGRYRSASEVVREGLRLLEIRESQLQPKPGDKKDAGTSKNR